MALFNITFSSYALGHGTHVTVILPDGERKTPCKNLYLLHGLSDNEATWLQRTSIARYADRYGIAVIMPDCDRSFYTDMKYGEAYYTYVSKELPERMKDFFGLSDKREDNFLAGNSMGGYGALKTALRENGRFAAAAGLSPCTDVKIKRFEDVMIPVFGESLEVPPGDDLFALAEGLRECNEKPRIFIGIGLSDFLYEENQRFRKTLTECGFDLTYRESPGDHCWDFWDEYIQYALDWMF